MSNIDIARVALIYARDGMHEFKSSNKINTKAERSVEKKRDLGEVDGTMYRLMKSQAFGAIAEMRPAAGVMMDLVVAHGRAALKAKAGNCQEYTAVVCSYLDCLENKPVFDAVYFEPPGDHTFTAIGQQPDVHGVYPTDFAQWSATAAICDPWANLHCLARDYPEAWKAKMRKWHNDGKLVSMVGEAMMFGDQQVGKPENASPLTDGWFNAPERYRKLSFTHVGPAKTKKKKPCYITTAVCTAMGLPDDCDELNLMRAFRDDVLSRTEAGQHDIEAYYATAPDIVATIDAGELPYAVYASLYRQWLAPAVTALKVGDTAAAYRLYKAMVAAAAERLLP